MKPGDAAKLLGIGRSTVSLWTSGEYREYFTSSAQGGRGNVRNITDLDLRILHYIDILKKSGAPPDDVHVSLKQMQAGDWENLPPLPSAPAGFASVPVVPSAAADAALSTERKGLLREIAKLEERVEQLENRLDEKDDELKEALRALSAAERELELWRSGRLKPE